MTFRDIFYLTAIAEEKSITKAASKLFMAQPALSQCVQKIEKEVGAEIFVRTTSGVYLTAEGQCLLKFAQKCLLDYQNMQKQILDIKNAEGGEILLGLTGTQATNILPYFLPRFKKMHPNIQITLVEDISIVIEEKLSNLELDIGIIPYPIIHKNLDYFELSKDDMVVIPRSCSRFRKHTYYLDGDDKPYLDIQFLKEEPLVLTLPHQKSRMICDQIFAKAGITPDIKQMSKNLVTLDALAQVDYATTIMPSKQISDTLQRRGYYYLAPEYSVNYSFGVATLKNSYKSMAAQKLLDMLYDIKGTF